MSWKESWTRIKPVVKNKYFIVLFAFAVWITLFDQNSLLFRHKLSSRIDQMKKQKELYIEEIENNKRKIKELQSSPENLEKFAREEYLMKKENEVVFVIEEE
jgi:cell division protein FtsB